MPLKLHNFGEPSSTPSMSYFCQKLETYFRAVGYKDYVCEAANPLTAPRRKLPYVTFEDGETMPDSHFIILHMISTGQVKNLDAHLGEEQKADARAWQGYIEELVYQVNVCTRYADDTNWATFCKEAFSLAKVPWALRGGMSWGIRREALKALWYRGTSRYSVEEISQMLVEAIKNVEIKLRARERERDGTVGGCQMYVFGGETPSMADVVLYSWLVCVLCTKSNPVQTQMVLASQPLRKYVAGLTKSWFPEYEQIMEMVTS